MAHASDIVTDGLLNRILELEQPSNMEALYMVSPLQETMVKKKMKLCKLHAKMLLHILAQQLVKLSMQ